jgi:hypothetical protein
MNRTIYVDPLTGRRLVEVPKTVTWGIEYVSQEEYERMIEPFTLYRDGKRDRK